MKIKNKYCIGMHVQFYEIDMVGESVTAIINACNEVDNKENITIDVCFNSSQYIEQIDTFKTSKLDLETRMRDEYIQPLKDLGVNVQYRIHQSDEEFYNVGQYRRDLNYNNCANHDIIIWGESDCLLPRNLFAILDLVDESSRAQGVNRYCLTFGVRKMWDESWRVLEHPDFTDKPFIEGDTKNWWSLRYNMTKEEMNNINSKTEELDVRVLPYHKFNGCGLVISSEVIKSGVNIPKSIFFVHEDTALMYMTQKVLGNIPQYVIKNILLVHNRKSPKKRMHIEGEMNIERTDIGAKRKVHAWYTKANKMCEQNYMNLFNPNYKSFTWKDVWNGD